MRIKDEKLVCDCSAPTNRRQMIPVVRTRLPLHRSFVCCSQSPMCEDDIDRITLKLLRWRSGLALSLLICHLLAPLRARTTSALLSPHDFGSLTMWIVRWVPLLLARWYLRCCLPCISFTIRNLQTIRLMPIDGISLCRGCTQPRAHHPSCTLLFGFQLR